MKKFIWIKGIISALAVSSLFFAAGCTSSGPTVQKNSNSNQVKTDNSSFPVVEIKFDYAAIFDLELVDEGNNTHSYTITGYKGKSLRVTIPEKINDIPVKRIGPRAFTIGKTLDGRPAYPLYPVFGENYKNFAGTTVEIISITIPDSVIEIGNGAFAYCSGLRLITLPKNLTEIKANTFADCKNLQTINIPETVNRIGPAAFAACISLETITLPGNIRYIGEDAFYYCSKLMRVIIPKSVPDIFFDGTRIFQNCKSLTDATKEELSRRGYVFK